MKNFPFLDQDLLPFDRFISYCADRNIKISRDLLELWHKKGLLYPCVRLDRGINVFRKIKTVDHPEGVFVFEEDLSTFNILYLDPKKYYSVGSFSYGKPNCLDFYRDNGMIEYPIDDKKFIVWNYYKFVLADFRDDKSYYKNYKILLYSKKQIYVVKHILDRRTLRKSFHVSPSKEIFVKLKSDIDSALKSFDENFIKNQYVDFIKFFDFLKNLEQVFIDAEIDALKNLLALDEQLNQDLDIFLQSDGVLNSITSKSERILHFAQHRFNFSPQFIADVCNDYSNEYKSVVEVKLKKISQNFDFKWLESWREKIMYLGFPSHQDFNLYKMIEPKENFSNFHSKGKIRFMLDCIDIIRLIEWVYKTVKFDQFISIEKIVFGVDSIKICPECTKSFIPDPRGGSRTKTCTNKSCRDKFRNRQKRQKSKLK